MTQFGVLATDHSSSGYPIRWTDHDAGATMTISTPAADPDRWAAYLDGARDSYDRHGVGAALDVHGLADGGDTALFWTMTDPEGRLLGGVRAIGPLRCAEDSHAVVEWAGQPGLSMVRKMIDDRAPFGILEMKTAWVTDDRDRAGAVSTALARSGFHGLALLGLQFCMATSAPHILDRWRTSGGVVAPIPATPYPDERYLTKMMWWDRGTFARHAHPGQLAKLLSEMDRVRSSLWRGESGSGEVADEIGGTAIR